MPKWAHAAWIAFVAVVIACFVFAIYSQGQREVLEPYACMADGSVRSLSGIAPEVLKAMLFIEPSGDVERTLK